MGSESIRTSDVRPNGTYVDPINHIDDSLDVLTIDQFLLGRFITRAICLDVSSEQLHVRRGP